MALWACVLLAALWCGGFAWFLHRTAEPPTVPAQADGIVVFTGGADRVQTALHLLALGRARLLLISGVGGSAGLGAVSGHMDLDPHLAARVTVGRAALSTRGNAAETAHWAQHNGLASLIVVTADYHMPRALIELSRALPTVRLYPMPVTPPAMRAGEEGARLRLLAGEYVKFVAAAVGLSEFGPRAALQAPEPARDATTTSSAVTGADGG
jgi:uncharacterized SAM-binding protein YcdF (DUF218 family)